MYTEFFIWWYTEGLKQIRLIGLGILYKISDFFSVDILLRTLFAPWKNDNYAPSGPSLQDKWEVFKLNFAGRFIGFLIRLCVLIFAFITIALTIVVLVSINVIWLFQPLVAIFLAGWGLMLMIK